MTEPNTFQAAMARFAGAVTIITTREGEVRFGMVATAVCSLSADPPSILACINKDTSAHAPILRQRVFAVNLMAHGHSELVRHFMAKKGTARFDAGEWGELATGAPILADAVVAFDCELIEAHDAFSHTVLFGRITGLAVAPTDGSEGCLIWHGRNFAKHVEIR